MTTILDGTLDELFRFDVDERERDLLWRGAAQELAHHASVLDCLSLRRELGDTAAGACKVIRVLTRLLDGLGWEQSTDAHVGGYQVVVRRIEFRTVLEGWLAAIDDMLARGAEDWEIDDALDARALVARLLDLLGDRDTKAAT